MERLSVLIADRAATRAGIRMALDAVADIYGETDRIDEAIRLAKQRQPDLCLVDAAVLGGGGGIEAISRAAPRAAIVVLAHEADVEVLLASIRAGAVGYVPGPLDASRLRAVVRAIAAGEAVVPRSMVLELLLELRGRGGGGYGLTAREAQVLGMLRRGQSTVEIADGLRIAPVTVRRHVSGLMHKLGVSDRASLVTMRAPQGVR